MERPNPRARRHSTRVHNTAVAKRLAAITAQDSQRDNPYAERAQAQRQRFNLPAWPTTTIGSFPQTTEIRGLRLDFKQGRLDAGNYRTGIAEHIKQAIVEQERLGLDVLVHGEAERNDMVEYFGEHRTVLSSRKTAGYRATAPAASSHLS